MTNRHERVTIGAFNGAHMKPEPGVTGAFCSVGIAFVVVIVAIYPVFDGEPLPIHGFHLVGAVGGGGSDVDLELVARFELQVFVDVPVSS